MKSLVPGVVLALCLSCITPVNLDPAEPEDILAVDGFITDQEGPFEIIIQLISRFAGTLDGGTERLIKDAQVFITDQNGTRIDMNIIPLIRQEVRNGCPTGCCSIASTFETESIGYRTPMGFRAVIGNSYTLNIILANGKRYQSSAQTVVPGPEIDSLSYRFRELPTTDPIVKPSGIDVFATWEDPSETRNFYSWRVNGIYRIETPPNDGCCVYIPGGNGAVCYINERNIEGNELAFSDERVQGMVTHKVGFIQDDGLRFANRTVGDERQYYIEVEQFAIPGEAFAFNRVLASQLAISGSIFDPPPAELIGNIRNLDDPDEPVVGFFGAYSVKTMGIFVNRGDLDFIQRNPRPCGDCRVRRGARSEVPEVYR